MTPGQPKFVPILSSYATRVSGRNVQELLSSPAGLARAIADTQRVVGHDGVLCFYAPKVLAQSCLQSTVGLVSAEEVAKSGPIGVVLEAIVALRHILPAGVRLFACCPGPALTLSILRHDCKTSAPELEDYDYVGDVFLALVRAASEAGANGIAIIEGSGGEVPLPEGYYRSARKLADFYSLPCIAFMQPESDPRCSVSVADCVFRMPRFPAKLELLHGALDAAAGEKGPATTNQDVPADVSVEVLQSLRALAMN